MGCNCAVRNILQAQTICFFFTAVPNLLKDIVIADTEKKVFDNFDDRDFLFSRYSSASHFSQPWTSLRNTRKHFHSSNVSCDRVPYTSRDMEKIIRPLTPGEGEVQQQRTTNFTSSQRRLGRVRLLSEKPSRKS